MKFLDLLRGKVVPFFILGSGKAMTTARKEVPSALRLTWRPTRPEDLEPCLAFTKDSFLHDAASRRRLLRFLRHLLARRACISVVIEDRARRTGRQVGFGLSLFLSSEAARIYRETPRPFQAKWLPEMWERGRASFLEPEGIARANRAGELDLAVLHYGWDGVRYGPEEQGRIAQLLPESFVDTHRGYRIREAWAEVYGEEERELHVTAGYRTSAEFSGGAGGKRVFLMGCSAGNCKVGSIMASIFTRESALPYLGLKASEQELLVLALSGATEGAISRSLGISPNTVKKRWQGIYQKVESEDPDLLASPGLQEAERLKFRRRLLLDHLRQHPEELRPY